MSRSVAATLAGMMALMAWLAAHPAPAQQRPRHRDPYFSYLVEGHVLRADGHPAAGLQIERAQTNNFVAESTTTDDHGAFRFEGRGLGWGPGLRWTVILKRAGCPDVTRRITLRSGPVDDFDGDLARDVTLRLPACAQDH